MKYLSVLIAFVIATSASFAQEDLRDGLERPAVDTVIERIKAALEGDLSDRRKAYLEHRLAYIELHAEIRAALRVAIADLGEDATRDERKEAHLAIRDQFSDQMHAIKDARRDLVRKRRANRGDDSSADG